MFLRVSQLFISDGFFERVSELHQCRCLCPSVVVPANACSFNGRVVLHLCPMQANEMIYREPPSLPSPLQSGLPLNAGHCLL